MIPCAIIVFGILISVLYYLNLPHPQQGKETETPEPPKSWHDSKLFRLEYEQLSEGIRARDNVTVIAGTILITASVLLIGTCMQLTSETKISLETKILMISASLAIYTIWLICFNLTSNILGDISYRRLEQMEESDIKNGWIKPNDMKLHRYIRERVQKRKLWKYGRRLVWLYFLWVLIIVSVVILSIPI